MSQDTSGSAGKQPRASKSSTSSLKPLTPQGSRRGSILTLPKGVTNVRRPSKNVRIRLDSIQTETDTIFRSSPAVRMENTYKTEPDEEREFSACKVEKVITQVFEQFLHDKKYSVEEAQDLSLVLANSIKKEVKSLDFPRYKIVCNVVLGEGGRQGIQMASRCLWNDKTDDFASSTFHNDDIYAVASVYGIYFD